MNILRKFDKEKPVRVYRNLQKDCYSVQQGGLVVAHTDALTMRDCQFIVQPAGRARVLMENRKNVHAFVKGTIVEDVDWIRYPHRALYNPYAFETFTNGMTWKPVFFAKVVLLNEIGVLYTDKEEL